MYLLISRPLKARSELYLTMVGEIVILALLSTLAYFVTNSAFDITSQYIGFAIIVIVGIMIAVFLFLNIGGTFKILIDAIWQKI